mmetsp:Transcript_10847/g.30237  ORF Transcript_10847/g.30237 Transcript_10847/m.30237 type:complete len:282 (+) Transcript_10847:586-1431(+)
MRLSARSRMSCVRRWSWIVVARSAASDSRLSEARPICFCDSAIFSMICWIFSDSSSMRASRSFFFCWRFDILWSPAWVSSLLVANSSMHQSRIFTSSSCCAFSSATSLSISPFTFVNSSISAEAAMRASSGRPVWPAAFLSTSTARARSMADVASRALLEEVCTRAELCSTNFWSSTKPLVVLSKLANASSLLRIPIVSSTAEISSRRLFMRCSNSASEAAHFSFRSARKAWSIASCSSASDSSFISWAFFSRRAATSASISRTSLLPAAISSSLAALSSS